MADNSYLIVGGGRVARNLAAYLRATGAEPGVWTRADDPGRERLAAQAAASERILLAVSDAAVPDVAAEVRAAAPGARVCHFSAVAETLDADPLHPAAAFPREVFDLATLQAIPFAQVAGRLTFSEMFPAWSNPVLTLRPDQRALYHAILVVAGNFANLVWNEAAKALEGDIGTDPATLLDAYIRTNLVQLAEAPTSSFAGPVTRGDAETLIRDLEALQGHEALKRCFKLMLDLRWPGGAAALSGGSTPKP